MILYSKNKKVLGLSLNELHILGFNSLEELNNYGLEKLFFQKRGFVFDFNNIFWPEFVINEVKQSFVILKNDKEQGEIFELRVGKFYLINEVVYSIELENLSFLNNGIILDINQKDEESLKNKISILNEIEEIKNDIEEPVHINIIYSSKDDLVEKEKEFFSIANKSELEKELEKIASASSFSEEKEKENNISFTEELEEHKNKIYKKEIFVDCPKFDINKSSLELRLPVSIIKEFLEEFLIQMKEELPLIKIANETKNVEKLELVIHKLKGAATNLRIDGISKVLINFNNFLQTYEQNKVEEYIGELEYCYNNLFEFNENYEENKLDLEKLNISQDILDEFLDEFLETSEDFFVDIERNINDRNFVDALEVSYALEDLVQTLSFDFLVENIIILQDACTNSNSTIAKEVLNKIMLDVNTLKGIKI